MSEIKTTKQVIVWNNGLRNKIGLKVRTGKIAAQISHASMAFLTKKGAFAPSHIEDKKMVAFHNYYMTNMEEASEWMENSFTKVVVKVESNEELMEIYEKAKNAGLEVHLIIDNGKTEFDGPTPTCIGIGPHYSDKIDAVTGHLPLL